MYEVYNQIISLIIYIILGCFIGIIFDLFRVLRKTFKTTDFITSIQDILFWVLSGSLTLISILLFNSGEIRSYIFIGIALGLIMYFNTISKFIIKYLSVLVMFFKKIFESIFKK